MARITLADRLTALTSDKNLSPRDRSFAGDLLSHLKAKGSLTRGRRVWVDRLEARAEEAAAAPKVEVSAELTNLHQKIVATSGDSCWAAGFMESVISQVQRGHTLSSRQQEALDGIREEYTGSWSDDYKSEYRDTARIIAAYYQRSGLPYWQNMVASILDDDDFVPSKKSFMKMWGNRYAQRVVEQSKAAPVFTYRQAVQVRSNETTRAKYRFLMGKKGFVLAVGEIVEAVKGGRGYTVLFAGDPKPVVIEERYLMRAKK